MERSCRISIRAKRRWRTGGKRWLSHRDDLRNLVLLALALSFFDIFSSSKKHLSASLRRTMANRSLKNHAAFEAGNCAAAEIILADLAKYDGEGALVVLWARRVLQGGQPGCESQRARRPRGCRPERAEGGGMNGNRTRALRGRSGATTEGLPLSRRCCGLISPTSRGCCVRSRIGQGSGGCCRASNAGR